MRIVIALDGSDCSKAVLQEVKSLQCPIGTEIKVVTALDFSEPLPVLEEVKERECAAAQKLIADAVKTLQETHENAEVTGEILDGCAIETIIQLSRNWIADLIIVGSHGRKGISRLWLGSVSRAILLHAPCAVRIIRAGRDPIRQKQGSNVLIALDQSEHCRHLIDHVLALPWTEGTKFRCINVLHPISDRILLVENSDLIPNLAESIDDIVSQELEWVAATAGKINKTFQADVATAEVLLGEPRQMILDMAAEWPADIIMLGSHGRQGIDKLILGSVSEAVSTNATCSVEVTRTPAFRKHPMHVIV